MAHRDNSGAWWGMSYETKLAAGYRAKADELRKIAEALWDDRRRREVLAMSDSYVRRAVALEQMPREATGVYTSHELSGLDAQGSLARR